MAKLVVVEQDPEAARERRRPHSKLQAGRTSCQPRRALRCSPNMHTEGRALTMRVQVESSTLAPNRATMRSLTTTRSMGITWST